MKIEIGEQVVFKWLGCEYTGTVWLIEKREPQDLVWVGKTNDSKYPCIKGGRFGFILEDKTEELQLGIYIKEVKTEFDYIMEDIQKSFDKLKLIHEDNFPKKKNKETKEVIKEMRKQLSDLQKLIDDKP